MMLDYILASMAVIGLAAATIQDLRTREVPDWVTYGLIGAGFGVRLIGALGNEQWFYFFSAWLGLGATFVLGSLMYYARQWGGGDAKMMMALGVLFATKPAFIPETGILFLGVLFINILLFGAVYGLAWGILLAWKHRKKFTQVAKALLQEKKMVSIRIYAIIVAGIVMSLAFLMDDLFIRLSTMTLALLILLYPYLWIYVKAVEKACLYKQLKPRELTEGDWVEQDIIINKKVIYKMKNTGIEKTDIQRLIKAKVKQVTVKEGIPFIPPFLLGTLATLLQINILTFI